MPFLGLEYHHAAKIRIKGEYGMRMRLPFFVIVLLSVCALFASADSKEQKIGKLLDVTGIKEQLRAMPELVKATFDQQKQQFGNETYAKIRDIIAKAFKEGDFIRIAKEEILAHYDEKLCDSVLKRYESKLFLDITKAEIKASENYDQSQFDGFDYSKVDEKRDAVIVKLIEDTDSIGIQSKTTSLTLKAFINSFNFFLPEENKITAKQLDAIIAQTLETITSDENMLNLKKRYAVIYKDFSNKQIEEYFSFYSTDEGKWVNTNFVNGFTKAFEACMEESARSIIDQFKLSGKQL
jgi:hypothetical protein